MGVDTSSRPFGGALPLTTLIFVAKDSPIWILPVLTGNNMASLTLFGNAARHVAADLRNGMSGRLAELGFETEYNVSNPTMWMAAASDTLQLVNFFNSTNTSYESNLSAPSKK